MKQKLLAAFSLTLVLTLLASASLVFADDGTPEPESTRDPNKQSKVAQRLADLFEVSYADIVGWREKGFGWGGIRIAYTLSANSGKPVSEIFALFKTAEAKGQGWGEIAKSLGVSMKPPKVLKNNFGNGDKPGNRQDKDKNEGNGNQGNGNGSKP